MIVKSFFFFFLLHTHFWQPTLFVRAAWEDRHAPAQLPPKEGWTKSVVEHPMATPRSSFDPLRLWRMSWRPPRQGCSFIKVMRTSETLCFLCSEVIPEDRVFICCSDLLPRVYTVEIRNYCFENLWGSHCGRL